VSFGGCPWRDWSSRTEGSGDPAGSAPDRIASRKAPATCSQPTGRAAGSGRRSGTCRCSVNGLPLHARSPHFFSRAYTMSSTGPRTLRTCKWPSAGLIVCRMYPSYHSRVDRSHSASAAYWSSS